MGDPNDPRRIQPGFAPQYETGMEPLSPQTSYVPPRSEHDLTGGQAHFLQCLRTALSNFDFPGHLFPPKHAIPFFEQTVVDNFGDGGNPGAANTEAEVVFHEIPEGMNGYLWYFGQEVEDLSAGLFETGIDFHLRINDDGVIPFQHFRGVISTVFNPTVKGLCGCQLLRAASRIHVDARIRTTAEGGLDDGTADINVVLAGWQFPVVARG